MSTTKDNRRFGGIARLYGESFLEKISSLHVCVVGLGGVGSWVVESLARSGVGHLTLIDGDTVAVSNTNRQLHALDGQYEQWKAEMLAKRVQLINPDCQIDAICSFVQKDHVSEVLPDKIDILVDCIDDIEGKVSLIAYASQCGIPIFVAGGAGGKVDPSYIQVADMAHIQGDPLIGKIRSTLRREYGFPKGSQDGKSQKFGITVVSSSEPMRQPKLRNNLAIGARAHRRIGFGASVVVTGSVGLRLTACILQHIRALMKQSSSH